MSERLFTSASLLVLTPSAGAENRCLFRRFTLGWLVLALVLLAGGCRANASGLPTVAVPIGNRTFQLEVARTQADLEKGLMDRDSMPPDHGMLFVFKDESVLSFWMKNTRFDLDIIYLDHTDKVVSIRQMKSFDLTPVSSDLPARYAIELNRGTTTEAGVHIGDVVALPQSATAP